LPWSQLRRALGTGRTLIPSAGWITGSPGSKIFGA
jgi:hypothetical protein